MASFLGQNPLAQYAKRKTSLCKDHFIHKFCTKGDSCHFAHQAPPNNESWKLNYCPDFFNGNCKYGVLCNYMHHPNKKRIPENLSGDELISALDRLNPYGYNKDKATSLDQKTDQKFVTKSQTQQQQQQQFHGKNQKQFHEKLQKQYDDATKKLGKVKIR